jgi:UPF0716 protein FxsA
MLVHEVRLPRWVFPSAVLLLTVLPLVELGLLIALGRGVGLVPTLLLCAATGFGGAWLARWQGLATVASAQRALAAGRFPATEAVHGALLLVGGVVLLTPGLVTDALGLLLLLPPVRRALIARARRWWDAQRGIVDGSCEVVDPPRAGQARPR